MINNKKIKNNNALTLIGRDTELELLETLWSSKFPEFLAVYGRRRIGKTFLITEFLKNKGPHLKITGSKNAPLSEQLTNFMDALSATFYQGAPLATPKSWREAFKYLTKAVKELIPTDTPFVLFLDELPWLAGKKSRLLEMLDYFWNTEWSLMPQFKLIACGSAASWMLENLVHATGGLHNRLTRTLLLKPFNLTEAHDFLKALGFKYSPAQTLAIALVTGGVAHYLKLLSKDLAPAQNIQALCFNEQGPLKDEFPKIFKALFDQAEDNQKIIQALAQSHQGLQRAEIATATQLSSGGTLTKRLEELEAAGFIKSIIPYGNDKKEQQFRVIDNYSLFYIHWIFPLSQHLALKPDYWQEQLNTPPWYQWSGYAFENICFQEAWQIARALKINDLVSFMNNWKSRGEPGLKNGVNKGTEIDLVFIRKDKMATLCEIKFNHEPFIIDKNYAANLMNKLARFKQAHPEFEQVELAFITYKGLKENIWSTELVDRQMTIEDLFKI